MPAFGQLIAHLPARIGVQRAGGLDQLLFAAQIDQFLRATGISADRWPCAQMSLHHDRGSWRNIVFRTGYRASSRSRSCISPRPPRRGRGDDVGGLHVHGANFPCLRTTLDIVPRLPSRCPISGRFADDTRRSPSADMTLLMWPKRGKRWGMQQAQSVPKSDAASSSRGVVLLRRAACLDQGRALS